MQSIQNLVIIFLPALLTCPVAMLVWLRSMARENWKQLLPWNIALVVLLNTGAGIILISNSRGFLPLSFFACAFLPIAVLLTYSVALLNLKRILRSMPDDPARRRALRIGMILIPLASIFMITLLTILMPRKKCRLGCANCAQARFSRNMP
jgi:hypothetical protein